MNGLNTAILIGVIVIIVAPLIFYIAAQQSRKVYKHGKRKFYTLTVCRRAT